MNVRTPIQMYVDQLNELDYALDKFHAEFRKEAAGIALKCYEAGMLEGQARSITTEEPIHVCEHPDCEGSKHEAE